MIIPGLLTASTNKADHLGMSTDRVACVSIIGAPFASVFLAKNTEAKGAPIMDTHATRSVDIPKWSALLVEAVNKPGMIMEAYSAFHNYSIGNQILALVQCQMR